MAYTIDWLVKDRVLYSRVWNVQTIEMVRESMIDLKACLDTGQPPIHLIFDSRDIVSIPKSLSQMMASMETVRHPALGWLVTVGTTHAMTRLVGTMLAKLFSLRFRRVETMGEALAFLQEVDSTIDWTGTKQDVLPEKVAIPN